MTQLYENSVVIDALNVSNWDSPAVYESLHSGQVTGINATIAIWENYNQTMDHIKRWERRFHERRDTLVQAKTVADLMNAKSERKTGVVFGWQNASPIENDLDRLPCSTRWACASSRSRTTSGTCWATGVTRGGTKV